MIYVKPHCHRIAYLTEGGDEGNTLQALWDYCQIHPTKLVSYIHSKGSFHRTTQNEKTRRLATKSTFDCRMEMIQRFDLSEFNIYTGTMIILPQYLSQANMWTAKCQYIQNLYPPPRICHGDTTNV